MFRSLKVLLLLTVLSVSALTFFSCGSDTINQIFTNEVSAKQRLDSANAQAQRDHPNAKLVMIFGRNVKSNGKTDISTITFASDPASIGSWLYIYRVPGDTSNLRIYTPNPLPGSSTNIELTAFFSVSQVVNLIQDTAARNLVSGTLSLLTNSNVNITTSSTNLIDSDVSLGLANTTDPIIKFDANYNLSASSMNGNAFFASGTNETINMMLLPAAGTLNLPSFIQHLTGFPNDLWIVNYTKTNSNSVKEGLVLGTVVQSNQIIGIDNLTLTSKVINISKYAQ